MACICTRNLKTKTFKCRMQGSDGRKEICNTLKIGKSCNKSVFKRIRPERPSAQAVCGNGRIS